jgi:hypothetical protein
MPPPARLNGGKRMMKITRISRDVTACAIFQLPTTMSGCFGPFSFDPAGFAGRSMFASRRKRQRGWTRSSVKGLRDRLIEPSPRRAASRLFQRAVICPSGKSHADVAMATGQNSRRESVRQNSNFARQFNADSTVNRSCKKYFASVFQNLMIVSRHPASFEEGRTRDRHDT